MDCDETSIVVYQEEEPHWTVTVNLTCPTLRQPTAAEGMLLLLVHKVHIKMHWIDTYKRQEEYTANKSNQETTYICQGEYGLVGLALQIWITYKI